MDIETPIVFVVDDDQDFRNYIKLLLESMRFQVASLESVQQFLDQYQQNQAGCLVSDIMMPGITGLEFQDILLERGIHLPLIFISGHGSIAMAKNTLKKGAMDFIEKPVNAPELINSVHAAIDQDAQLRKKYHEIAIIKAQLARLTTREKEVLDFLLAGDSNKSVAKKMDISLRTVESHRNSILHKMHVNTFVDLIRLLLATPLDPTTTPSTKGGVKVTPVEVRKFTEGPTQIPVTTPI